MQAGLHGAGEMKLGQRVAEPRAMRRGRPADPHAVQEGDDRGRTPGEPSERLALAVLHRLRAGQSARREMLHQTEKERQIIRGDALLVERENEIAATGVQEKIRVLDALRDAFIGQKIAEVVGAQECRNFLGRDIGIDGHGSTGRLRVFRWVAFPRRETAATSLCSGLSHFPDANRFPFRLKCSYSAAAMSRNGRGNGKNTSSSAAVTVSI